jgi:SWI/SNF-related matrix-associated actin-dependent regulator of chromatin subfamily A-like protein 1
MLKDIIWTGPWELTMHKTLWSAQELALAKCMALPYNEDDSTIIARIETTTKIALIEFLNISFVRVMTHPSEESFRNELLQTIDQKYQKIFDGFIKKILPELGYQDLLWQHQKQGLCDTYFKQVNLLAWEMRTGKTNTAISISKLHKVRRTIIIVPNVAKWTWFFDLTNTDPKKGRVITQFHELYFSILDSNKSKTVKAFEERFIIINFEAIEKHLAHILSLPIGHIIIDEAHYIKNFNSARYKNVAKVVDANPTAKITMLTGTPIANRVNDLFAYLKLGKHPLAANYALFLRDFSQSSQGRGNEIKITGVKNANDLWMKLSNFMLRKRQADCFDIPPKNFSQVWFELDDYKEEYDIAVRELLERDGKSNLDSCIHSINIVVAKSKIKGIIEQAEMIISEGKKVCIYSSYKEPLAMLMEHFGKRCVKVDGSVTDASEKQRRRDEFTRNEEVVVFLGNMQAAGIAIDLSISNDMMFTNFPLSPGHISQSMERLTNGNKQEIVNIWYMMCRDSIDEHLFSLVAEKTADANAVIDNKQTSMEYVNVQEVLIKRLREQYNIPIKNGETEINQGSQTADREPALSDGAE